MTQTTEIRTVNIVCPHCQREWGGFAMVIMVMTHRLRCQCGAVFEPHLDSKGDDHRMALIEVRTPPCAVCMGEGSFTYQHRLQSGASFTRTYLCDCGAGNALRARLRADAKRIASDYTDEVATRRADSRRPLGDSEHARIRDKRERQLMAQQPACWRDVHGAPPPDQQAQLENWRTGGSAGIAPPRPDPAQPLRREEYAPLEDDLDLEL